MKQESNDTHLLKPTLFLAGGTLFYKVFESLSPIERALMATGTTSLMAIGGLYAWDRFSKYGRAQRKRLVQIKTVPLTLLCQSDEAVLMGTDEELMTKIFLPNAIRSKHVHLVGATGSGKTESVILNFLNQDVKRGLGSIILDAKGDASFLEELRKWVPEEKLKVFDLGDVSSLGYNPLSVGSALESAQRLFSSLTWSEEYYKSKALATTQRLFQIHFEKFNQNPTLMELAGYLETPSSYAAITMTGNYPQKMAEADFAELSGLRDQIRSLCIGHLSTILSPKKGSQVDLNEAETGSVIYFRLQSLLSPQLVAVLGKLIINHLSFLAGSSHRVVNKCPTKKPFIPVYLDEFASFACPEFADLISKARSAGFALHFSHQSIGDLAEVSKGFLNQITDNSATKIIMRINDPDSAEFFSRSFGTKVYQKVTQRITKTKEIESTEFVGEGSSREAHQFRSSPDLFKTLPTGVGSVLIAHGEHTPQGASHVLKIKFPKLEKKESEK